MTLLPWIVLVLLLSLNALYVAAEFAMVAVPRPSILTLARQGHPRAQSLSAVLEDRSLLDRYISACQIGITVSSLLAGAYAQATVAQELAPYLGRWLGLEAKLAWSVSALSVLVGLTSCQVVLGELIPKQLALEFPEKTALLTFLPTQLSVTAYRPFIGFLNGTASLILRPFGVSPGGHQHVHSPQEIELLLNESKQEGALTAEAHQRLRRGLRLSTRTVRQLMVPRSEIHAIEISTPPEQVLSFILTSPYSRLPVYRGTMDQIVGSVSSKDLASVYAEEGRIPALESLLRPIAFVPESLRADRLIGVLEDQRTTKAIVVSEFGGVQGIVTIEDVLAELLGNVSDELKEADPEPIFEEDGRVRIPGSFGLGELEALVGKAWEGSAATVGGQIIQKLGRFPDAGEVVELDGFHIEILDMAPRAIRLLTIHRSSEPSIRPPELEVEP